LKVFEVEVEWAPRDDDDLKKEQKDESDKLISQLQSELKSKEESLQKTELLVSNFQRKQGIGLTVSPHSHHLQYLTLPFVSLLVCLL
jgi:hypothetical protein